MGTLRPNPHDAKEFENGGFTHQMLSVHTAQEEYKDARITGHFGFVLEQNDVIILTSSFTKSSVFKRFSVHTKTKRRCFQIPPA